MNMLTVLNTSHQTIKWFADKDAAGLLQLRPGFQRRPVWNDEEKAFLIDSVLRGYPIPEIYVQSVETDSGDRWDVVDGQQRLRACLEFFAGTFPITFDVNKLSPMHSLDDTPWYGKRFAELEDHQKTQFRRYKLIVRDLEEASDQQVRHVFHRLNQSNVVLNSQELRYSIYQGGLIDLAEKLVSHPAWDHFRMFTKQQRRRMLDSEYISELVIGHLHFPQNKKDDLDDYYRRYATVLPGSASIENRFDAVLRSLVKAFPKAQMGGTRWYRKSDFYTLFLALTRGTIPMIDDSIEPLVDRLVEFSDHVSRPAWDGEPASVTVYRDAVERAATDRGRRVRREEALVAFLEQREVEQHASSQGSGDGSDDEDGVDGDEEYADVPVDLIE